MATDFQLNVKLNGVEQAVSTVGELESALKATRQELKNVEVGSEAFDTLTQQSRTLQNELKEVKESLNFDKNIGQLGESVSRLGSSITSAFTIATSAVSLFGGESEELSEAQVKAQQALALALSATTIAANAAKLSGDLKNVSDALGLNLTRAKIVATEQETAAEVANTTATTANAVATGAQATATGAATVAQERLNVAMKANPIGLIITGITALVGVMALLSDGTDEAAEEFKKFKEESDKAQESIDKGLYQSVADISTKYNEMRKAIESTNDVSKKQTWLKEAIKLLPELSELAGKELENQEKIVGALQARANLESLLAEREAVLKKISDYEKEIIQSNREGTILDKEKSDYITTSINVLREQARSIEDQITYQRQFNDALVEENKLAKKIREEAEKRAEEEKRKAEEAQKKRVEAYKNALKDIQDTYKDLQKIEEDFNQKSLELTYKTEEERIEGQRKLEVEKVQKIQQEKLAEAKKFGIDQTKINDETQQAIDAINAYYSGVQTKRKNKELKDEQERLRLLREENAVLQKEVSFGDQNTTDLLASSSIRRTQIKLDNINQQIALGDFKVNKFAEVTQKQLALLQQYYDQARQLEIDNANAEAARSEVENIKRLESENKVTLTKVGDKYTIILEKDREYTEQEKLIIDNANLQKTNAQAELNLKLEEIDNQYRNKKKEADKAAEDEILAYRLQKINEYASFAVQGANSVVTLISNINAGARQEEEQAINEKYSKEQDALNRNFNAGLISRKEYDAQNKALNDKRDKAEYDAKKKAFEQEKKLKIAQAIIAGAQGALSAFTGAMQLGPIAGPIVGGILAALVVAATAVQVSNISKQKFDGGAVPVTPIDGGAAAGAVDTGAGAVQQGSSGGFTGFTPNLTGGGATPPGGTPTGSGPTRVYVVESDITDTQNRVRAYETNATF